MLCGARLAAAPALPLSRERSQPRHHEGADGELSPPTTTDTGATRGFVSRKLQLSLTCKSLCATRTLVCTYKLGVRAREWS